VHSEAKKNTLHDSAYTQTISLFTENTVKQRQT